MPQAACLAQLQYCDKGGHHLRTAPAAPEQGPEPGHSQVEQPLDQLRRLFRHGIGLPPHDALKGGHRRGQLVVCTAQHRLHRPLQVLLGVDIAVGPVRADRLRSLGKDMYYEVLADRVHYFKEDEKGVAIMCKAMEDMRNEAAREAEKMKAIRMARLMIEDGKLNYEDIAMYTELTLEEVEKIALEKKSA